MPRGVLFAGTKLYEEGRRNEALWDSIRRNSRAERVHCVREPGVPSQVQGSDTAVGRQKDVDVGALPMHPPRCEHRSAAEASSPTFGDDFAERAADRLESRVEQRPGRLGKMEHFPGHEARRVLRLANPFR